MLQLTRLAVLCRAPAAVTHKQQEADVRASAAASALAAAADPRHSKHGPKAEELANLNVIIMSDVLARAEAAEKLVEAAKERAYRADRENARLTSQLGGEQEKTTALRKQVMARRTGRVPSLALLPWRPAVPVTPNWDIPNRMEITRTDPPITGA